MLALLAPEAIEKRNAYGSTALVLSCRHASLVAADSRLQVLATVDGDLAAVEILLAARANPAGTTPDNESALYFAAQHGFAPVVQALINDTADPNQVSLSGMTPLHKAACNGHEAVMKILITAKSDVNQRTPDGETALNMLHDMARRR